MSCDTKEKLRVTVEQRLRLSLDTFSLCLLGATSTSCWAYSCKSRRIKFGSGFGLTLGLGFASGLGLEFGFILRSPLNKAFAFRLAHSSFPCLLLLAFFKSTSLPVTFVEGYGLKGLGLDLG
jgi:hypothetical protein